MPAAAVAAPTAASSPSSSGRKANLAPEKKYKCQFCNRAFSRSEHRSRHERSRKFSPLRRGPAPKFCGRGSLNLSVRKILVANMVILSSPDTKERPFKCLKCRSTFVRRDLLLRHDRTVHRKDGGVPLHSGVKRRAGPKASSIDKTAIGLDTATLEQIEASSDGMVDIETAAMLMTDFHHKAMASQEPEVLADAHENGMSPDGPALLEPSVSYASGAVSLPQMPWDSFLPQSVPESKVYPISSRSLRSKDSSMSFGSVSTVHAPQHHHQLPPMMDRERSSGDALALSFQSLGSSLPVSGLGTPGALSPYPSMMGPVSPVDYRRSPGPTQVLTMARAPQIESEDACARILSNIRMCDGEVALLDTFRLPSVAVLNRYLSTYFNLFHHHLPFLHPASFDPLETSAPLLLAVLSIGALYTFEQDQAYMLHIGSKVSRQSVLAEQGKLQLPKMSFVDDAEHPSQHDICQLEWRSEGTGMGVLDQELVGKRKSQSNSQKPFRILTQSRWWRGNRYELKLRSEARVGAQPTHEEWIEDEGCRRTYYVAYIFFGLMDPHLQPRPGYQLQRI